MEMIVEYTGAVYLAICAIALFYYGYINKNKMKIEAKFLNNYIRFFLSFFAGLTLPITLRENLSLGTLLIALIIFGILLSLMYFGGCKYNISVEDYSQIKSIIESFKNSSNYQEILIGNPKVNILLKKNNGFTEGYTITIKTGFNVNLANKIKRSMAERLRKVDNSYVNYRLYMLSGIFIMMTIVGISLRDLV